MKKLLYIVLITLTAFAVGCDRFENDFKTVNNSVDISEFIPNFQELAGEISENNTEDFMAIFSENYNYDDYSKETLEEFIQTRLLINSPLSIDIINYSQNYVNWKITSGADVFSFYDYLKKNDNGIFELYGNQALAKKGFIELFTGTWCQSCPKPEAALHHLKSKLGSMLSYIEYHFEDLLEIPEGRQRTIYYLANPLPVGIVQGIDKTSVASSAADAEEDFQTRLETLTLGNPKAILKNVQYTNIDENGIQANVDVEILDDSIITSTTELCYSIVELEDTESQNNDGVNVFNVVKTYESLPLTGSGTKNIVVDFEINKEDFILVIWIQDNKTSFSNSSEVYNVIESLIPENN